jgi:S1-C subfamily serine protease
MNLAPSASGLVIEGLERGSDAAEKLERGYVITRVNGREVRSVAEFQAAVNNARRLNRGTILVWVAAPSGDTGTVALRLQPSANG